MTEHPQLNRQSLQSFLEQAPLYAVYSFAVSSRSRSAINVEGIECYCSACNMSRPFIAHGGNNSLPPSNGSAKFSFVCVTCMSETRELHVQQSYCDNDVSELAKYGELPRQKLMRDAALADFFRDDSDCLEKATICIAHGYGIGAFAYLRRILENHISDLLDMLIEEAQSSALPSDTIDAINELKKESHMSDKIAVANKALPAYLIPDGVNPLGRLYKIFSEAIHSYSETECLDKARDAMSCLTYLVKELTFRHKSRKEFAKEIRLL